MSHESGHVIISKLKAALNAPLPGGGKWWHVLTLCVLSAWGGAKFF